MVPLLGGVGEGKGTDKSKNMCRYMHLLLNLEEFKGHILMMGRL
jgi:hypothetical protein